MNRESLMARISADFEPNRRRRLEVPEWGEPEQKDAAGNVVQPAQPLVIHYDPVTLADQALVSELDGDIWPKRAARFVVLKSLDAEGRRIFQMIDAVTLMTSAKPDVVNRIALAMVGRLDLETASGN